MLIKKYLSSPNFSNYCNKHIGNTYTIFIDFNAKIKTKQKKNNLNLNWTNTFIKYSKRKKKVLK